MQQGPAITPAAEHGAGLGADIDMAIAGAAHRFEQHVRRERNALPCVTIEMPDDTAARYDIEIVGRKAVDVVEGHVVGDIDVVELPSCRNRQVEAQGFPAIWSQTPANRVPSANDAESAIDHSDALNVAAERAFLALRDGVLISLGSAAPRKDLPTGVHHNDLIKGRPGGPNQSGVETDELLPSHLPILGLVAIKSDLALGHRVLGKYARLSGLFLVSCAEVEVLRVSYDAVRDTISMQTVSEFFEGDHVKSYL